MKQVVGRLHAYYALATALALPLLVGCGDRPSSWDTTPKLPLQSVGLTGSVAVVDPSLDRVLMLTSSSGRNLGVTPLGVGKNVVSATAAPDRESLVVLSSGVQPRRNPGDERPSLTLIEGGLEPRVAARYTLTDPLRGLALDPVGKWAVVYEAGGIVINPNELIFVDLENPGSEPVSKTIRSFGSKPERLTFTSELALPQGPPRRFLIVETGQDIALIDLFDLERPEVTIPLPKTPTGKFGRPLEVDFHDGDPADSGDARIAIRLADDPNVVLVELGPPAADEPDKLFKVTLNVAPVGGIPSAISFVQTDGGLRLAALVPTIESAALVDPATTVTQHVDLLRRFDRLTRITDEVGAAGSDVALLWSEQANGIAFWSLGTTSGTPFRSVDPYDIGISVTAVRGVPGELSHLKILESGSSAEFYVLDLQKRQSSPMLTNAAGFELSVAPDGKRAWALRPGTKGFASIDLFDLHPISLEVERDVSAVYDIERKDGGRAVVALHAIDNATDLHAGLGATVLDALEPDTASSKFHPGLLLGGRP